VHRLLFRRRRITPPRTTHVRHLRSRTNHCGARPRVRRSLHLTRRHTESYGLATRHPALAQRRR
jgi:hypothetical protein